MASSRTIPHISADFFIDNARPEGLGLKGSETFATGSRGKEPPLKIEVFDNQIEPALKALKKEMLKGGIFKEMKRRAYYEKPSVKRKRKQAEARKKRRKALKRSQGDYD